MMFSRYETDSKINQSTQFGTANNVSAVRKAIREGRIGIVSNLILTGADRLDALAGTIYGDARFWWVLAAASDIGWGLQVPPGTNINIIDLNSMQQQGY